MYALRYIEMSESNEIVAYISTTILCGFRAQYLSSTGLLMLLLLLLVWLLVWLLLGGPKALEEGPGGGGQRASWKASWSHC